jgi:hypothetical protein
MLITTGRAKKKSYEGQLFFSAPLDTNSAQNGNNYQVTQRISKKKLSIIRVLGASYSAANNSVTLTLGKTKPGKPLQLTVSGLKGAGGTPVGTFVTGL